MFKRLTALAFALALFGGGQVFADVIDGEELVDPTRPLNPGRVSDGSLLQDVISNVLPASYELSFIRASSSSPMAVINRQRVTVGDSVGGAQVMEIDRSGVTLMVGNEERRISLYDVSVKTTSNSQ